MTFKNYTARVNIRADRPNMSQLTLLVPYRDEKGVDWASSLYLEVETDPRRGDRYLCTFTDQTMIPKDIGENIRGLNKWYFGAPNHSGAFDLMNELPSLEGLRGQGVGLTFFRNDEESGAVETGKDEIPSSAGLVFQRETGRILVGDLSETLVKEFRASLAKDKVELEFGDTWPYSRMGRKAQFVELFAEDELLE